MKPNRFYLYSLVLLFFPLLIEAQVVLQALDSYFSITLESGKKRIASIYDADYFPYNINPRSEALWQRNIAADGAQEPLVIDHQGKITTTGLRVGIPVTVQGNGFLPAYSVNITIPTNYTEDGNSRVLLFSWEQQFCSPATTYIVATIRSLDGDLLIKKLDMNMGFGTDVEGLLMGAFSYPNRYTGAFSTTSAEYKLYAVTGIPDRCLGKTTSACVGYGANVREHDFIYTPLVGPDGKVWLGNNLGAEYAKYGSEWFDPAAQGGTLDTNTGLSLDYPNTNQIKQDWRAYGSLFQWQRNPDGHELINWTSSATGTPKYNNPTAILSTSWTTPNTNQFIYGINSSSRNWVIDNLVSSTSNNLWQANGATNPCPNGYHVPTHSEHVNLHYLITRSNASSGMWREDVLRLPAGGARISSSGLLFRVGNFGYLWSGDQSASYNSWYIYFSSNISSPYTNSYRSDGFNIRCLEN
ncbi:FISUMP domain-containing protein [Riemerella anatipestifer]|uniref:FISUMP domain-containing protein n=1 Tax=Riemerella anatipestifer TaxID=34085 RepID=UPI001C6ECDF4|nr:FISUMP domain-containing protein [Riemerella anatipestifer]QYQ97713.1 hypothetical protein J6342_05135 [Riemerella anatipestifer]